MNRQRLESMYQKFLRKFQVDSLTGVLKEFPDLKFATMPYIGSNYFLARRRILFIGMDIGADEAAGIQSLEDRHRAIERPCGFNPHIAGTYCTALYLLKEQHGWEDAWARFTTYSTYSRATKKQQHKDDQNPLSFVALTNLHKFVTVDREYRAGDSNRKFLQRDFEESFLLEEVKLLRPDTVVLQGQLKLSPATIQKIKEHNAEIIRAPHPSYRVKGGRNPTAYTARLTPCNPC